MCGHAIVLNSFSDRKLFFFNIISPPPKKDEVKHMVSFIHSCLPFNMGKQIVVKRLQWSEKNGFVLSLNIINGWKIFRMWSYSCTVNLCNLYLQLSFKTLSVSDLYSGSSDSSCKSFQLCRYLIKQYYLAICWTPMPGIEYTWQPLSVLV